MARLMFFGSLGDQLGARELTREVPAAGMTVAELLAALAAERPELAEALAQRSLRVAVDQVIVGPEARLGPRSEVALMPPFSGG